MHPKIFLMYYDRYDDATTSQMLDINHTVLCHSNADKFNCIGNRATLVQTNEPKGIQNNFNYALRTLKDGDWAIFMSDDCVGAKILHENKFIKCSVQQSLDELINILPIADKMNVKLVGMNATGNAFYAKKKYSKYGLIDGRCFAIKKTDFEYHPYISTIPDYYATAYHLKKYNGNLILNYTYVDFKRYSPGGLQSADERLPDKINDIKTMLSVFPNNVQIKQKPGQPKNSHIIIKR